MRIGIPGAQNLGEITISVYDIMGQRIKTLFSGILDPGIHSINWDGKDYSGKSVSGGTYYCYLKSKTQHQIRKMILLK